MTRLACRGCGESCPEEARRSERGTTLKALKGDEQGLSKEGRGLTPRGAFGTQTPGDLTGHGAAEEPAPGFSRLVSEESGGRWGLFTSDRPAWPHLSQECETSINNARETQPGLAYGCDQQSQTLFSTGTDRCLKLGRNL